MTRREGIIAAMGAMIGMMSGRAVYAADDKTSGSTMSLAIDGPQKVTFNLGHFKDFTFTLDKEEITLTSAEIMAALKKTE